MSVFDTALILIFSRKILQCNFNPIRNYIRKSSLLRRFRNINLISIDYSFRSRLRYRLTLPRTSLDRNSWTFGGNDFHVSLCYLCQHPHFQYLQHFLQNTFNGLWKAPLPRLTTSEASVDCLAPLYFRRKKACVD